MEYDDDLGMDTVKEDVEADLQASICQYRVDESWKHVSHNVINKLRMYHLANLCMELTCNIILVLRLPTVFHYLRVLIRYICKWQNVGRPLTYFSSVLLIYQECQKV